MAVSENAISGLSLSAEARLLAARHLSSLATVFCLSAMLKITVAKSPKSTTLRVEGRLAGPWVDELERAWRGISSDPADGRVAVDLTDVTFVGEEGKRLLEAMYGEGAKLIASGCVTRRLVEDIELSSHRLRARQSVPIPE